VVCRNLFVCHPSYLDSSVLHFSTLGDTMVKLPKRGLKATKVVKPTLKGWHKCDMCTDGKIGGKPCNACSGRGKRHYR